MAQTSEQVSEIHLKEAPAPLVDAVNIYGGAQAATASVLAGFLIGPFRMSEKRVS